MDNFWFSTYVVDGIVRCLWICKKCGALFDTDLTNVVAMAKHVIEHVLKGVH